MKHVFYILILLAWTGCSSTKKANVPGTSADHDATSARAYGYDERNPIKVGGGPSYEREYLNHLTGPNGEKVTYVRQGSCCPFKTPNALFGDSGMLDRYEVTYEGQDKPAILYLNMYDKDTLRAPEGFILKNE